jgi:hypothetical protein
LAVLAVLAVFLLDGVRRLDGERQTRWDGQLKRRDARLRQGFGGQAKRAEMRLQGFRSEAHAAVGAELEKRGGQAGAISRAWVISRLPTGRTWAASTVTTAAVVGMRRVEDVISDLLRLDQGKVNVRQLHFTDSCTM